MKGINVTNIKQTSLIHSVLLSTVPVYCIFWYFLRVRGIPVNRIYQRMYGNTVMTSDTRCLGHSQIPSHSLLLTVISDIWIRTH